MKSAALKRTVKLFLRDRGLEVSAVSVRGKERLPGYVEQEFRALYQKYHDVTMVPWSGLYSAYKAVRYLIDAGVEGDIVECGVWKGGCVALMMEVFHNAGQTDRQFYLYDTFEGMTKPSDADVHFSGAQFAVPQYEAKQKKGQAWSHGSLQAVRETLERTSYPQDKVVIVEGDVVQTLESTRPESIALLRLDTDWYESTRAEMAHLYPLLMEKGIFICDDYGSWRGSYQAVEEYFQAHDVQMYLHVDTAYGGATGVKVA